MDLQAEAEGSIESTERGSSREAGRTAKKGPCRGTRGNGRISGTSSGSGDFLCWPRAFPFRCRVVAQPSPGRSSLGRWSWTNGNQICSSQGIGRTARSRTIASRRSEKGTVCSATGADRADESVPDRACTHDSLCGWMPVTHRRTRGRSAQRAAMRRHGRVLCKGNTLVYRGYHGESPSLFPTARRCRAAGSCPGSDLRRVRHRLAPRRRYDHARLPHRVDSDRMCDSELTGKDGEDQALRPKRSRRHWRDHQ